MNSHNSRHRNVSRRNSGFQPKRDRDSTCVSKGPRRRRSKRFRVFALLIFAVLIVTASVLLIVRLCSDKNSLRGRWDLDGVTYYSFDGEGRGALELPENSYVFTYSINGDSLSIDFENENLRDFTYDFKVAGNKLTLVGGEGNEKITYDLSKTK